MMPFNHTKQLYIVEDQDGRSDIWEASLTTNALGYSTSVKLFAANTASGVLSVFCAKLFCPDLSTDSANAAGSSYVGCACEDSQVVVGTRLYVLRERSYFGYFRAVDCVSVAK
eukprot:20581-Heterococcus_DN1.PRE.2